MTSIILPKIIVPDITVPIEKDACTDPVVLTPKISIKNLNFYYSDTHALKDVGVTLTPTR
jgi:hypothetical protein